MTHETAYLTDRGVVRVSGADAESFLQGLVTNDVANLPPGQARYAALLTPQGKILFDFFVVKAAGRDGAAFLIDCPAALAADLVKRRIARGVRKSCERVFARQESAPCVIRL